MLKINQKARELQVDIQNKNFGREMDASLRRVEADLGDKHRDHIRRIRKRSKIMEGVGRTMIHFSPEPLSFSLGVMALWVHKQLETSEIGHMALLGVYDHFSSNGNSRSMRSHGVTLIMCGITPSPMSWGRILTFTLESFASQRKHRIAGCTIFSCLWLCSMEYLTLDQWRPGRPKPEKLWRSINPMADPVSRLGLFKDTDIRAVFPKVQKIWRRRAHFFPFPKAASCCRQKDRLLLHADRAM
jgi:hypothetical protein